MKAVPDASDPEMEALIAAIRHEVAVRRHSETPSAKLFGRTPGTNEKLGIPTRTHRQLGRWLRAVGSHRMLRQAMRYVRGGRRLVRALPRLARIDELLAVTRDVIAHEQTQRQENAARQTLAVLTELRADINQLRQRLEVLEAAQVSAPPAATAIEEEDPTCAGHKIAVFESHSVATRGAERHESFST